MRYSRVMLMAALALSLPVIAAQDPAALLERARASILDTVRRLRHYTCVQTVNRSYFHRVKPRAYRPTCDDIIAARLKGRAELTLIATDRLRLEVAIADSQREIYSWAGAGRIDTDMVTDLVGGGPVGTGAFGPFLVDIFTNPGAVFSHGGQLGEPAQEPGTPLEYRFQVPVQASHYQVHGLRGAYPIAYVGAFWLDPDSAELKRLRVRTAELPPDTGACEATTTVTFERARIGSRDFLLARASRLRLVLRNGDESENGTVCSDCREYAGESTVRFGEEPDSVAAPAPSRQRPALEALPPDLPVLLSLQTEIDTESAAAGDFVTARVLRNVTDPEQKRILIPAGAVVRGRIVKMEHHVEKPMYFLVSMWLETVEFAGQSRPFPARLRHGLSARSGQRPIGSIWSRTKFPASGTFVFRSPAPRYVVPRGFESEWFTTAMGR